MGIRSHSTTPQAEDNVSPHADKEKLITSLPITAQLVICNITMTMPYGGIETDANVSAWDWVDMGGRELLQMRVSFRDSRGTVLDTKGMPTLVLLVVHDPYI